MKALQAQWPSSDQARSALVPKCTTRGRNSTSCSSENLEILIRALRHDVVLNRLLTLVGAGWGVLRHAGLGGRALAIQVSPSAGSMMQKGPTRMSFGAYWRRPIAIHHRVRSSLYFASAIRISRSIRVRAEQHVVGLSRRHGRLP